MEFVKINISNLTNDYLSGMSLRECAIKYKTSKLTIKRKLENNDIKVLSSSEWIKKYREKHNSQSANRHAEDAGIITLYEETKNIAEVSHGLGLSIRSVTSCLKRNDIAIHPFDVVEKFSKIYNKVKPEWFTANNLEELYNSGHSVNSIARMYNYDAESVRGMFIKCGIDRRETAEATMLTMERLGYESSLEKIVRSILDDFGIDYKKVCLGGYEYDLLIDNKYLLEINGNFVHANLSKNDDLKKQYYLDNLVDKYEFHVIWEHEYKSINSIFNRLNEFINFNIVDIDLQDLEFKIIDSNKARAFYNKYHYKGKSRGGTHCAALLGNDIICCGTFNNATRKQSSERLGLKSNQLKELIRFSVNPRYHNTNIGSYCMSRFIRSIVLKYQSMKCLISFCELDAGHSGGLYRACNWKYDGKTEESYHYQKNDNFWHKRTIWKYAKQMNMKENEFVKKFGISKIKTGKKLRFLFWIGATNDPKNSIPSV